MKTLNADEMAALCHVKARTIYKYAKKTGCGRKIGKRWIFLEEDVINFLRGNKEEQQCRLISTKGKVRRTGNLTTLRQVEKEYNALLELPTRA